MISLNQLVRWETPLSSARSVAMTALNDETVLSITFNGRFDTCSALVCFTFRTPHAYKVQSIGARDQFATKERTAVERRPQPRTDQTLFSWCAIEHFWQNLELACDNMKFEADRYVFFEKNQVVEVVSGTEPDIYVIATQTCATILGKLSRDLN